MGNSLFTPLAPPATWEDPEDPRMRVISDAGKFAYENLIRPSTSIGGLATGAMVGGGILGVAKLARSVGAANASKRAMDVAERALGRVAGATNDLRWSSQLLDAIDEHFAGKSALLDKDLRAFYGKLTNPKQGFKRDPGYDLVKNYIQKKVLLGESGHVDEMRGLASLDGLLDTYLVASKISPPDVTQKFSQLIPVSEYCRTASALGPRDILKERTLLNQHPYFGMPATEADQSLSMIIKVNPQAVEWLGAKTQALNVENALLRKRSAENAAKNALLKKEYAAGGSGKPPRELPTYTEKDLPVDLEPLFGKPFYDGHLQYMYDMNGSPIAYPLLRVDFGNFVTTDGKRVLFIHGMQTPLANAPGKENIPKWISRDADLAKAIGLNAMRRTASELGYDYVGTVYGSSAASLAHPFRTFRNAWKSKERVLWRRVKGETPDADQFFIGNIDNADIPSQGPYVDVLNGERELMNALPDEHYGAVKRSIDAGMDRGEIDTEFLDRFTRTQQELDRYFGTPRSSPMHEALKKLLGGEDTPAVAAEVKRIKFRPDNFSRFRLKTPRDAVEEGVVDIIAYPVPRAEPFRKGSVQKFKWRALTPPGVGAAALSGTGENK